MKIITHGNLKKFPQDIIDESVRSLMISHPSIPVYCVSVKYNKMKDPNFNVKRHLTEFIKKKVKDPEIFWQVMDHNFITYVTANYYSKGHLNKDKKRKLIATCRRDLTEENIEFLIKNDAFWVRKNHFTIYRRNEKYDLIHADGVYQKMYTDLDETIVRETAHIANVAFKISNYSEFDYSTFRYIEHKIYQFIFKDVEKLAILKMLFD